MQNINKMFEDAGIWFSTAITNNCLTLDLPVYPLEIKSFIASGALDESKVFDLFSGKTVTISFNHLPEKFFKRLSSSYVEDIKRKNVTLVILEEGDCTLCQLRVERKGIILETTVGIV